MQAADGKLRSCTRYFQASRLHLRHVIGKHCLFAATVLPCACLATWCSAQVPPMHGPVAVWCCLVYVLLEIAAFAAERAWSSVGACCFWSIAGPFLVLQVVLCTTLARSDLAACFLISVAVLGARETLFEMFHASQIVGGYDIKERFSTALLGGFAYAVSAGMLSYGAFTLVRVARMRVYSVSASSLFMLFVFVLPAGRSLSRMLFLQLAASASEVLAPLTDEQAPRRGASEEPVASARSHRASRGPPAFLLDGIVLRADVSFALAMFLEVPCAFALLLVPQFTTFACAVTANAFFDVISVFVFDTLQQRGTSLMSLMSSGRASGKRAAPVFCFERPVSIVATLLTGSIAPPGHCERERLMPRREAQQETQKVSSRSSTVPMAGDSRLHVNGRAVLESALCSWRTLPIHGAQSQPPRGSGSRAMSPRVSRLLDEFDVAMIHSIAEQGSSDNWKDAATDAQALLSFQDRKMALVTYLLGNTVAAWLASACFPMMGLHVYIFSSYHLFWRIAYLLFFRGVADLVACSLLDFLAVGVPSGARAAVWEGSAVFSTFSGWVYRATLALSVLLVVMMGLR